MAGTSAGAATGPAESTLEAFEVHSSDSVDTRYVNVKWSEMWVYIKREWSIELAAG